MNINTVSISARLTSDPEIRNFDQSSVTSLRCVTNNYAGKGKEVPVFFDVKIWGKIGEFCHKSLVKGDLVFVSGRLDLDTWEKDGQKNSRLYITANSVIFDKKNEESSGGKSSSSKTSSKASSKPSDDGYDEEVPF